LWDGWTGIYNFYNRQDDIAFVFSGGISCSISYNTVTMAHGAHEPLKAGNWRWLPVEGVKGRRIGDYSNHFVVDSPIHQTKGAV
jgi:hypothetical protein